VKIDIMHMLYTAGMIILAFTAALVVTKSLSKFIDKKKNKEKL